MKDETGPQEDEGIRSSGSVADGAGPACDTVTHTRGLRLVLFCSVLAPAWLLMRARVTLGYGRGTAREAEEEADEPG